MRFFIHSLEEQSPVYQEIETKWKVHKNCIIFGDCKVVHQAGVRHCDWHGHPEEALLGDNSVDEAWSSQHCRLATRNGEHFPFRTIKIFSTGQYSKPGHAEMCSVPLNLFVQRKKHLQVSGVLTCNRVYLWVGCEGVFQLLLEVF